MYSVEILYRDEGGEVFAEKANIPCASNLAEAKRIMREWLAARCPVQQHAVYARLMEGEQERCFHSLP